MTESLREKVESRLTQELGWRTTWAPATLADVAHKMTDAVFAELAGARPCVTCGKGIGPAKVAKGYVQCYGCRGTTVADRAEMQAAHAANPASRHNAEYDRLDAYTEHR